MFHRILTCECPCALVKHFLSDVWLSFFSIVNTVYNFNSIQQQNPHSNKPGKQCCVRSTVACLPTPKPANKIQGPISGFPNMLATKSWLFSFSYLAQFTLVDSHLPPKRCNSPSIQQLFVVLLRGENLDHNFTKLKLWTFVGVCGSLCNFTRPVSLEATGFQPEICSENFYQGNWWS